MSKYTTKYWHYLYLKTLKNDMKKYTKIPVYYFLTEAASLMFNLTFGSFGRTKQFSV